jgi:hypothetical protein
MVSNCGDPDVVEPLRFIEQRYVLSYLNAQHDVLKANLPLYALCSFVARGWRPMATAVAEMLEDNKQAFRRHEGHDNHLQKNGFQIHARESCWRRRPFPLTAGVGSRDCERR